MVTRRLFVLALSFGSTAASSLRAGANNPLPTVAILVGGRVDGQPVPIVQILPQALAELGLVDGRTVRIEVRDAGGRLERLGALVDELVALRPAVIIAGGGTVTAALVPHAVGIPIVTSATGIDPVRAGWAKSYSRPQGNVTGLTLSNDELIGRQIQILKEFAPTVGHLGILWTQGNTATETTALRSRDAAQTLGLRASISEVTADNVEQRISELRGTGVDALFAIADPAMDDLRERIAAVAIRAKLPTAGQLPFYADAGFLMSYSADLPALHRRTAVFVHRILQGTPPGEIPFEAPSKFVLRVNAQTAKAIGVEVPGLILALADEVIE